MFAVVSSRRDKHKVLLSYYLNSPICLTQVFPVARGNRRRPSPLSDLRNFADSFFSSLCVWLYKEVELINSLTCLGYVPLAVALGSARCDPPRPPRRRHERGD